MAYKHTFFYFSYQILAPSQLLYNLISFPKRFPIENIDRFSVIRSFSRSILVFKSNFNLRFKGGFRGVIGFDGSPLIIYIYESPTKKDFPWMSYCNFLH